MIITSYEDFEDFLRNNYVEKFFFITTEYAEYLLNLKFKNAVDEYSREISREEIFVIYRTDDWEAGEVLSIYFNEFEDDAIVVFTDMKEIELAIAYHRF